MIPCRWTVERIGSCGFPVNPLECPEAVCRRYLPHGRRQGRYRVAGDLLGAKGRSLFVRLRPPGPPGRWTDAATGEHGDLLDLIAAYAHEGQYSKLRVLAMIDAAEDVIVQFEQAEARHRRSFAVHVLFKRRRP